MKNVGLKEVDTYVSHLHNMVTQFITTNPIMELCLTAERRPGKSISNRWWEQDGVDVEGMRTAAREAEGTESEKETDTTETDRD